MEVATFKSTKLTLYEPGSTSNRSAVLAMYSFLDFRSTNRPLLAPTLASQMSGEK